MGEGVFLAADLHGKARIGNVYTRRWTRWMSGILVRLVRLIVETFFGGEGVPPSQVRVGKEVLGQYVGLWWEVVYTTDGCLQKCVGETPTPRKAAADLRGWKRILGMYIHGVD